MKEQLEEADVKYLWDMVSSDGDVCKGLSIHRLNMLRVVNVKVILELMYSTRR